MAWKRNDVIGGALMNLIDNYSTNFEFRDAPILHMVAAYHFKLMHLPTIVEAPILDQDPIGNL